MASGTVLVVDDDLHVTDLLSLYLTKEGFRVEVADNGADGLRLALGPQSPDLVILDIMLPELDGWEVCRRIRSSSRLPVIMLTARDEDHDKILGLEIGADDYVTKPFNPREVVARVKSVLRRMGEGLEDKRREVRHPGLRVSLTDYETEAGGVAVPLTPKETELLWFLASHPGQVFSRDRLLREVWGYDYTGDARTVDTHVKRLRHKLAEARGSGEDGREPAPAPWEIVTVWGVGYKFQRLPSPERGPGR
ncbi:MAG: response regulator transcription factor [Bacillota bacterium]